MLTFLALALMVLSLFLIPLGLPGIWIMVGVVAVGTIYHAVSLPILVVVTLIALASELAEYGVTKRLTRRYGGSNRAFWGALLGGFLGVFFGLPIPIVGSVVAGILGSFLGAGAVTYWETRHLPSAGRVGWGVVLGRMLSAAVKMAAGIAVLVLGGGALLL